MVESININRARKIAKQQKQLFSDGHWIFSIFDKKFLVTVVRADFTFIMLSLRRGWCVGRMCNLSATHAVASHPFLSRINKWITALASPASGWLRMDVCCVASALTLCLLIYRRGRAPELCHQLPWHSDNLLIPLGGAWNFALAFPLQTKNKAKRDGLLAVAFEPLLLTCKTQKNLL